MLHKTKNRDMIKYWESCFTQRCQNRPFKGRSKNLNHGPSWLGHHWSVRPFIQTSRPVSLRTRWIKPTDYRLKNRWNFNFNPLPSSIIEWKFEFSNFSNFLKISNFKFSNWKYFPPYSITHHGQKWPFLIFLTFQIIFYQNLRTFGIYQIFKN